MKKSAQFSMRMDPQLKEDAEALFARYGFGIAQAVTFFLEESLRVDKLPFELRMEKCGSPAPAAPAKKKAAAVAELSEEAMMIAEEKREEAADRADDAAYKEVERHGICMQETDENGKTVNVKMSKEQRNKLKSLMSKLSASVKK